MICLTVGELLHAADRAVAGEVQVRDVGLLEAAAARPRASAFGSDAYPTAVDHGGGAGKLDEVLAIAEWLRPQTAPW